MDGRPSLADAYIFNMLGEHVSELGVKGDPFMNLAETNKVLESFLRLRARWCHFEQQLRHPERLVPRRVAARVGVVAMAR